ncbi:tetratricopeptide repeat protein [Nitrosopumilus maritimus]|uniref:Tetratricopeptide TPR_2 repeat protein n=1 Tax=Nitrosopumilus maritimus (strain SCM1) TaxID=436308 RepID=A9A463_NITMS|nr:tetratricopeptide repeat protein [Nitrosopumilus maritimus]ABX12247.1 Tetratricopeptide TPR_2 repeat protein [Nitrosopumilus maritimus SCM1]
MRLILGITLVLTAFTPLAFNDVFADSFNVSFNQDSYQTGDTLVISGQIIDFGMPVIAMSIFDPDEKILTANSLELSSDGSFSKTIPLESPFYEMSGDYLIKLDYGQVTEEHNFVIGDIISESEIAPQEVVALEIMSLYTEKEHYFDGDTVNIFGTVSSIDSPTILIGVHDPFGTPAGFYFGNINNNLEFSTNFLIKDGVNFKAEGTYSIKAHYAETSVEYFFEYSAESSTETQTTEDTTQTTEDTTQTTEDTTQTTEDTTQTTEDTTQTTEDTTQTTEDTTQTTEDTTQTTEDNIPRESVEEKIVSQNEAITETINEKTETETKIITKETQTKNDSENILENEEHDNLSVEDIELGKLLNQINLDCDSSTFVDTISYYDGMGPALYRLCQFDSSLNFFNESLTSDPDNVEILVNKGSTLGKIGFVSEAIAYYDHAISLDPQYLPAKNNKANALANLGNLDDAILLYNEILEENTNYYTARTNLNTALLLKSETSETSDVISTVKSEIETSPENTSPENIFPEKTISTENKNETQSNFFEELTRVFSSLFGFTE